MGTGGGDSSLGSRGCHRWHDTGGASKLESWEPPNGVFKKKKKIALVGRGYSWQVSTAVDYIIEHTGQVSARAVDACPRPDLTGFSSWKMQIHARPIGYCSDAED